MVKGIKRIKHTSPGNIGDRELKWGQRSALRLLGLLSAPGGVASILDHVHQDIPISNGIDEGYRILQYEKTTSTYLRKDVWDTYRSVRVALVRHYLGWVFLLSIILFLSIVFLYWLSAPDLDGWVLLILSAFVFVVSLFVVPSVRLLTGNLVGWRNIEYCNRLLDEERRKQRKQVKAKFLSRKLTARPNNTIASLGEIATTNASAEWGAVSVFGMFTSLGAAVLAFHYQIPTLSPDWEFMVWIYTAVIYLALVLSALVANADTVIRQTLFLRSSSPHTDNH